MERIHDISVALGVESMDYPGDPPFRRESFLSLSRGDVTEVSVLHMSCHAGTHLDFPAHFIPGGKTLSDYPLGELVMPAQVIAAGSGDTVEARDVEASLTEGVAALFQTRNSRGAPPRSLEECATLGLEAARRCAARGVPLVGIDAPSVDAAGSTDFPVHHALLGAGVLVLEGLCLRGVPPGRYRLHAVPLSLPGSEASPVRAYLLA